MLENNQYHVRHHFQPDSEESDLFEMNYFYGFDPEEFKKRCQYLERINLNSLNDYQIRNLIRETITFFNDITNQSYYFIPTWVYSYKKGDRFYRVRKIKEKRDIIPCNEITKWRDLWNPPVENVNNYGRLNYPKESLLYTAYGHPMLAIKEMRLKDNERFALITYEALEDIDLTMVGCHKEISGISKEENEKREILTSFFSDIFTREVSEDNRHLYKLSANLIKECYTFEDDSEDGWIYPSIANKMGYNACFKEKSAKIKLKVVGVEICRLDPKYDFIVNYVLDPLEENMNFSYHNVGSDIQKEKYPHIKSIR